MHRECSFVGEFFLRDIVAGELIRSRQTVLSFEKASFVFENIKYYMYDRT